MSIAGKKGSWIIASFIIFIGTVQAQIDPEKVNNFIEKFALQNGLPEEEIKEVLDQAQYVQKTVDLMQRPAEGMAWHRYRDIFITPDRITKGVEFWKEHDSTLRSVSSKYGVPEEIILGILGVETYFGERKGEYRVLDALYTLAFGYPRRSKYFTSELEHFLLLSKEENIDPLSITGSYAGAIGYCQFMPSSYRAYAKSFEEGSNRDLVNSPEDAMASIANYLNQHKWKRGEPTIVEVSRNGSGDVAKQSLKPKHLPSYYEGLGFKPTENVSPDGRVTLITLDEEDRDRYWFGFQNFYVITRYNHSPLYAMAVIQLSEEIMKAAEQP